MMKLTFLTALLVAAASQAAVSADDFVRHKLGVSRYETARADLNGDGRPEVFVYVTQADYCGSGGCTLFILSPRGRTYRIVMHASATRPPIRLLRTSGNGWRDVGVLVAGGGIEHAYTARLRFNGRNYPGNPTVPPAVPLARPADKILIPK